MSDVAVAGPAQASLAEASSEQLLAALSAASAAEQGPILLEHLRALQGKPLDLSRRDGARAMLRGIDLGRAFVQARSSGSGDVPAGASPTTGGIDLRNANMQGADLGSADLSGADLRGAQLNGAVLEKANLHGALLDGAALAGADLAGADLREAHLGKANLDRALLEDSICRGASFRFASLHEAVFESADLRDVDLWSAEARGCCLVRADLRDTTLTETDLRAADLSGTDLRGARLTDCRLEGAVLRDADLAGALVRRCDLQGADLADADCTGVDFTSCRIDRIRLCSAWLERTRLDMLQLNGMVGEEEAREFERAALAYSALERNFSGLNDRRAAVWAYLRRRRMQKAWTLQQARAHWRNRQFMPALSSFIRYGADVATELLCDYGESVPRVLGSLLVLFAVFTVVYGLTGSVVRVASMPGGSTSAVTYALADLALFSFLTMTSGAPSGELAPAGSFALMLTGLQLFVGIALIGLLGFVLGNRIRR